MIRKKLITKMTKLQKEMATVMNIHKKIVYFVDVINVALISIKKILQEQNSQLMKSRRIVSWTQWENRTIYRPNRKKPAKRMYHVKNKGTMKRILNQYITQLEDRSFHQFSKIWQMKQFNCALRNLRKGQVMFVHDFSQNILLYCQDEP